MIRFLTLGSVDLRGSDGQELRTILAQPKRVALLAYVALAAPRGPCRRDTLLPLFWPEDNSEHARNSLSQSVHVLRRSLGSDVIVSHNGDTVGLSRESVWCDAVEFENAIESGRLPEAVALYRGDLLDGFHVADAPEFDLWLETERARLSGKYAQALEAIAQKREAAGDVEGAVSWWRRLAGRDPYSSRVALHLMRALAASGDPAGAVKHARAHETLLREELEMVPDQEIVALVRDLQAPPAEGARRPSGSPLPRASAMPVIAEAAESTTVNVPPDRAHLGRRWRTAAVVVGLLSLLAGAAGSVVLRKGAEDPHKPLIRSLAVLPLENLSGDPVHQSFTDGMHDVLITELARYPELSVISRTSVMQYRGTTKSLPEIARELKVDGLIEGALLREGGRVRLTAQLVHGPSDRHLWAHRYERDAREVLLLQGELAEAIAREVNIAAKPVERASRRAAGPADSAPEELYLRELYLRGRHAELSRSPVGIETAREAYGRAIERDSTFVLGYAGLAAVYGLMADYAYAPVRAALDTARVMALRAVALDSTLPETRTAFAVTLGDAGDFKTAEREFQAAIRLGPSDARARYWYGILLVALGRGGDALREIQRAAELDPFAPRGVMAMDKYARYLMTGERPSVKMLAGKRAAFLKREPGEPWARSRNAVDLARAGNCPQARSELQEAQHLAPHNLLMAANESMLHWFCGDKTRARALLQQVKTRRDAREHGVRIAAVHTLFAEKDSAFVWLERTEWTMIKLTVLRANEWLDPLRSDARYARLLHRLGLRTS